MPLLFTCPECHTKTQVEDRYSGLSGQCVTCGAAIQIPRFTANAVGSESSSVPPGGVGNRVTASRIFGARWVGWAVATVVTLMIVGSLLFTAVRFGGQTMSTLASSREQSASIRNLERIADALNAYAADQGAYPPPYTVDAQNRKLHSWRVLLLPYLGEQDLYNAFDLNLAWDHPVNQTAVMEYPMPAVYQHPSGMMAGRFNECSYCYVIGNETLFPGRGPLGPDDILDDPSQTILVTEGSPNMATTSWIEPADLDFAMMQGRIGASIGNEAGGWIDGGVAFVTSDGRGHFLPDTTDPATFRALVTPRGGERLPDDLLD